MFKIEGEIEEKIEGETCVELMLYTSGSVLS